MTLFARPEWHARAACRGQMTDGRSDWFPTIGYARKAEAARAREMCAGCPVRAECATAGRGERYGIWGGDPLAARRSQARQARTCHRCGRRFPHDGSRRKYCTTDCADAAKTAQDLAASRTRSAWGAIWNHHLERRPNTAPPWQPEPADPHDRRRHAAADAIESPITYRPASGSDT